MSKLSTTSLLTALLAIFASSCADMGEMSPDETRADSLKDNTFAVEAEEDLRFSLEESPGFVLDGEISFDSFCDTPAVGFNLTNAAWMAYWSANEYSQLSAVAPALSELGFGNNGDLFWAQCGKDLHVMRAKEKDKSMPAEFWQEDLDAALGTCGRNWFEATVGAPPPKFPIIASKKPVANPGGLAARFEQYLVQNPGENSKIQFFSGGEFSAGGKWEEGPTFEAGTTQVFWAQHSEKPVVVIAFRGTEPGQLKDLGADLDIWQNDTEDSGFSEGWGDLHRGFLNAYLSVEAGLLIERLKDLEGQGVGIWLTGHSLGGAVATVFAARILDEIDKGMDINLKGLYTFGSPRVGDSDFVAKFNEHATREKVNIGRVRYDEDLVTKIPGVLFGYRHVKTMVLLGPSDDNEDTTMEIDPTPFYDFGFGSADDHASKQYYEKLSGLLKDPKYQSNNSCL